MKNADVNFCSVKGLALTQVLNFSKYFSLLPNITRITFFRALNTGYNFDCLAPP